MQTLWARVAKSPCSCNCSSCFSSTATVSRNAVARRAGTGPIRRRLGADDVFAAFFSTVAFASAVADGNRKDAKKEEWIRVIRDARSDLTSLKAEQRRRISNLANTAPLPSTAPQEEPAATEKNPWSEVFHWGDKEMRDRRALGFEDWQGIPLDVLRSASQQEIRHFLQKCTHHFPRFKGAHGPEVWSTVTWPYHIKKIKTLEWSIANLALDFISQVPKGQPWSLPSDRGTAEEVLSQLSVVATREVDSRRDYIDSLLRELALPKRPDEYYHQFESPRLPNYSASKANDTNAADQLNANLHLLFEHKAEPNSRQITQVLPKVCYYLLTSNSPPSIHTYNILISEFAGARRDDLIDYLISSMHRTHMRPNEVTLAEILRHHVRTNNQLRFDRYVRKMDGFDYGIGEAHPRLEIPNLLKFRYRVRVTRKIPDQRPSEEYLEFSDLRKSDMLALQKEAKVRVYEKPRRNLEVHQALIQGALYFHEMSEAIKHYRTMINEGWEPDQEVLLSILHGCQIELEWESGIAVWRRLQSLGDPIEERGFVLMLQLCQKCSKQEHIQEILHKGVSQGVLPPTVLEMAWDVAQTQEAGKDVIRAVREANDIGILKESLRALLLESFVECPDSREESHHIGLIASQIEGSLQQPNADTVALLHEARMQIATDQKFSMLGALLRDSDECIRALVSEFNGMQFSVGLGKLEERVFCKLSSVSSWLEQSKHVLFSSQVKQLEDRVAASKLSVERLRTQIIETNVRLLRSWFYGVQLQAHDICTQVKKIQLEMSRYVVGYFVALVEHQHGRMAHLSAKIRATWSEVERIVGSESDNVLRTQNIELFGARGAFRDREEFPVSMRGCRPPKRSEPSEGSDSESGITNTSLDRSTSKPPSVEATRVEDPSAWKGGYPQDHLQVQTNKEPRRKQGRDIQNKHKPFESNQRLTTPDLRMDIRELAEDGGSQLQIRA
ncbi:MAG: hypothetical protein LQ339_007647 [Xanthoria mediterranea]|nr:MAG: hypothetical protein LQ339_007647 [Xanthoria mediterranea]